MDLQNESQLQEINGIGPKTEERLNAAGVFTLSQLAALSAAEVAAICGDLVKGPVAAARNWIDQAVQLLVELETQEEKSARTGNGLHYAVFHVKLLLDDDAQVRRTEVNPLLASAKPYKAAGWQPNEVVEYIEDQASLKQKGETPQIDDTQQVKKEMDGDQRGSAKSSATLAITKLTLVDNLGQASDAITFREAFWRVSVDWAVEGADRLPEDDSWTVMLYLNPIGKGEEIVFGASDPIKVSTGSHLSGNMWAYKTVINVDPTVIAAPLPNVFRLAVAIVGHEDDAARLPMAYQEGEIVSILEPA